MDLNNVYFFRRWGYGCWRKIRFLFSILIICLNTLESNSQQITFSKIYYNNGYHFPYSFVEINDSGFILVGNYKPPSVPERSFAMRTNKFGDSIWTRTYSIGAFSGIVKINDSSVLVCGTFDTSKLAVQVGKLNLNGDTILIRDYGYPPPGGANGLENSQDGGFIVKSGQTLDYEFLKLDSNLNEQFHRNVYNMSWGCDKILSDPAGGYVAVGSGNASLQPYEVARFDSAGGQIWQYHYGNQPAWDVGNERNPRDLVFLPDSNFLVCTNGFDWQLMKINRATGDTMWTRNYYDTLFPNVYYLPIAIDYAGNNHYILANNGNNSKIMLIDENGDTIWTRPKPMSLMQIYDIKKTSDGGFAMCGYYYVNSSTLLLAFAKIDSLGNGVFTSVFNVENSLDVLTFYPNPATNEINISPGNMANEKNLLFILNDLQGRTIFQKQYDSKPIDVSTLPEGLYIATLKGKEKELRGKVVIQR